MDDHWSHWPSSAGQKVSWRFKSETFLGRKFVDRRRAALVEHFLQEEHLADGGEDEDEAGSDGQIVDVVVVGFEQKKIVRLVPSRLVQLFEHGAFNIQPTKMTRNMGRVSIKLFILSFEL